MDCSGFIYYVLRQNGITDVPRDSSQQYVWVRKAGNFRAVLSRDPETFEVKPLLATGWHYVDDTTMEFDLRHGYQVSR